MSDQVYKVKLRFSAKGIVSPNYLSNGNYQIKVFMKTQKEEFQYKGSTQVIQNKADPDWDKQVEVEYYFEINQLIRFQVHHTLNANETQKLGQFTCPLGKIMGNPKLSVKFEFTKSEGKPCGQCEVVAQKVNISPYKLSMKWTGILPNVDGSIWNMYRDKTDGYLVFFKQLADGSFVQVHKTEVINNELQPKWKNVDIPIMDLFAKEQPNRKFLLQCWDFQEKGDHQFIGKVIITLAQITQNLPKTFTLVNPKLNNSGTLTLHKTVKIKTPHFIHHLENGLKLSLTVALDFTASNCPSSQQYKGLQPYQNPNCLHYISKQPQQLNHYQRVLRCIWDIILNYDSDKKIPALGFGGKPHYPTLNDNKVSHCFPLSGSINQIQIQGFDRLMEVYLHALKHVQLSGPTIFQQLLKKAFNIAEKSKDKFEYQILLILTDGQIHDIQETMDIIIQKTELPISIVIVGIGRQNFQNMHILNDRTRLISSKGVKCERDIVHFLQFQKYAGNNVVLTKQILSEIPDQVLEYYNLYPPSK